MGTASAVASVREYFRSGMKTLLPVIILAVYTLLGALLFQQLEGPNEQYEMDELKADRAKLLESTAFRLNSIKGMSPVQAYNHTIKTLKNFQDGLGVQEVDEENKHWSIFGAIFYCMTVYTTIGYGKIVPLTTAGRILTILYAFIGIPLTVICLYSLGQLFARICRLLWKAILKSTRMVSKDLEQKVAELGERTGSMTPAPNEAGGEDEEDLLSFPISLLVVITILWILLSAALFLIFESEWSYGTSLYFTLISFTTIGFGDVLPSEYDYMIFVGILVIIGLALVSTVMTLIQQQIEALADGMKGNIDKEYLAALADAKDEGEIAESKAEVAEEAPENVDVEAHIATMDPRSLKAVVSRMPLKSRVLYHIMPAGSKKQLEQRNEARMATRSRGCQTEESLLQELVQQLVEAELLKQQLATQPAPAYETSLQ